MEDSKFPQCRWTPRENLFVNCSAKQVREDAEIDDAWNAEVERRVAETKIAAFTKSVPGAPS